MAPDELRNLLGLILGRVGEVLAEYDLAAIDRVPIYWTRTPEGVKYQDSEAPPDYVVRALEAFRDLWQRQARENRDRDDAQRSIDSEAARRLWDDA